jgi:ABC-2 type transport system ATP-binding protein
MIAATEVVLEAKDLRKSYGPVMALSGVSLSFVRGEIFALLGPNGAGKTTCLEILEGLRRADSGTVSYFGGAAAGVTDAVRERIGVQLQQSAFFPYLGVEETLRLLSSMYRRHADIEGLIARFSLREKRRALVKNLSGGQAQRLALAGALVNEPELVYLDEPTTGLDTQTRHALWDEIGALSAAGTTVVLTTHSMEEAQGLARRIAILDHGSIIAEGGLSAILERHGGASLEDVFLGLTGRALRD